MSSILTRSGSKRRSIDIPLTIFEGDETEEEASPKKRIRTSIKSSVRNADLVTMTPGEIKAAIVQLTKEDKYCQKLYEFKTDKGDKHQIAIVFTECDKKGDKKGGKKPFYSRKGRRNKRSRKTRKRK